MTKKEQYAVMDKIVRELFANGGPQRATAHEYLEPKHKPNPVLLREQERLLKRCGGR